MKYETTVFNGDRMPPTIDFLEYTTKCPVGYPCYRVMRSEPVKLLGLCGPSGVGKTTYAKRLENGVPGYHRMSFATPIKEMVSIITDIHKFWYEGKYGGQEIPDEESLRASDLKLQIGCNTRHLWQTLGTEWGRDIIDNALWVRLLAMRFDSIMRSATAGGRKPPFIVIDDVRFPEEAEWIHVHGGKVLRLNRPTMPQASGTKTSAEIHRSETSLPAACWDAELELTETPKNADTACNTSAQG